MIKRCRVCGEWFEGTAKRKYCSPRCKKNFENSLRSAPNTKRKHDELFSPIPRPATLSQAAAVLWDKLAPTVIARGHLNVLSADAFAELCDIYSRLEDVNHAINENSRSLIQVDGTANSKTATDNKPIRESTLSDLKRKYSKQFLDYCKEFYLTPRVNRGNYGLRNDEKEFKQDSLFD